MKFQAKRIAFSQELNAYSIKLENTMKELWQTYDRLKATKAKAQCDFESEKEQVTDRYETFESHLESIYEQRMIETVDLMLILILIHP